MRQCPYSRVVIAKGNSIDEPLGFVHKKDLLDQLLEGKPFDIERALREPVFVPDTSSVLDVLELFREKRNHFAFVLDEFGTFEGVVTLTDVLEAITGDIPEEHDTDTRHIIARADGSSLVDGRTEISALESALDIDVPSDARFHTVAGLRLRYSGASRARATLRNSARGAWKSSTWMAGASISCCSRAARQARIKAHALGLAGAKL